MKVTDLKNWLQERILACEQDIELGKERKAEFPNDPSRWPHREQCDTWLENVKGRREAFLDTISHIECKEYDEYLVESIGGEQK